jgi:uncharacterized protein
MNLIFDPEKDAANLAKHGISLGAARDLNWDAMVARFDVRRNYGEARAIGYVPMGNRLYCVVYTDRGDVRRIISLRKAGKKEIEKYESEI